MFETVTAPATTPITVDDAKTHLALTINEYDAFLDSLIWTATALAETYLNGCILDTVRRFYCDGFASMIRIPHGLVSEVTSVEYRTANGEWKTLESVVWDSAEVNGQAVVFPRVGQSFPSVALSPYASIRITFKSGFSDSADSVPELVKHALRLIVGYLFEHRDDGDQAIPTAAQHLLAPFRTVTQEMF